MQNNLDTDFHLSHSIINYLNAQFRAHFAFVNALQQLGSSDVNKDQIVNTQKNLTSIVKWTQDLAGGMPIFSSTWKYPETFDAQKAFDILSECKEEIKKINHIIQTILESNNLLSSIDDLKYMVAVKLRYIYGRENYIKGFIEYAKSKNNQELHDQYALTLPQAKEEIKIATALFKEMKEKGELSPNSLAELKKEAPVLKGIFRSYINDINFFLSIFEPKYTFERAEFTDAESKSWLSLNFDANTSAYWRAYDFKAEESSMWMNANIYDPASAYIWKQHNFIPEEAAAWFSIGAPPQLASQFRADGQTPESVYTALMKQAEKNAA